MMMDKREPIRIAQIMGKLWAGGVEAVIFNYYRALDKDKVQFDFYYDADSTIDPPQELLDMGARFFQVPPYQKLPVYLMALKKHFREYNYLIVHSHINALSVFPLFIAWSEHVPIRIAHSHSVLGGKELKRNILKILLKMFSRVFSTDYFACSENAGKWLFGSRMFDNGKVMIVQNAIDFERFRSDRTIMELYRRCLGLEQKFVVGHIGRFTYAKNHIFLISIFEKICKLRDDAILLLVGDGELRSQIVEELRKKRLIDRTVMVGKVSDPENYYGLINVVILPSIFEGLPLTAIESQVAGIPIVVSEAIPQKAVISNGCVHRKLSDSIENWARTAIELSNTIVMLDNRSDDYKIDEQAKKLTEWYMMHAELI